MVWLCSHQLGRLPAGDYKVRGPVWESNVRPSTFRPGTHLAWPPITTVVWTGWLDPNKTPGRFSKIPLLPVRGLLFQRLLSSTHKLSLSSKRPHPGRRLFYPKEFCHTWIYLSLVSSMFCRCVFKKCSLRCARQTEWLKVFFFTIGMSYGL